MISAVARDRAIFRGEPDHVRGNVKLTRVLGGDWPTEAVAIPMMVGDNVALVFYGDNVPNGLPVGSTFTLEETLTSVGKRLAEDQQ